MNSPSERTGRMGSGTGLAAWALAACLALPASSLATEIIYTPVNPSFGGNPLNGSILLNEAQAQQNPHSTSAGYQPMSSLEQFQSELVQQVLSTMAQRIATQALGSSGSQDLASGNYDLGNYHIQVNSLGNVINVSIQNSLTGESTQVQVPKLTGTGQ